MAKTQKPLTEMIPELLQHLNNHMGYLEFNERVFKVLEGQLRKEVEESLRVEVISDAAYRRIIERIPPINVLQKATSKLSKVYIEAPNRLTDRPADQETLDGLTRTMDTDNTMVIANRLYNALHSFALEPYIDENKQALRALAPHQFLPYSDNPRNPLKMTVFMKLLGSEVKERANSIDKQGYDRRQKNRPRMVTIIAAYSQDEILVFDSDGDIRADKMAQLGLVGANPFGRIPFVYKSKSNFHLVPAPNQSGLDISVLIPKLLADLNYAAQFLSHSIIWVRNADLNGQELNPDAIVDLGDKGLETGEPEMGVIDPKSDIPNVLEMIEFELRTYFTTIGIKMESNGQMSNGRDASGIAKAIDSADVSEERKEQIEVFRQVERELWEMMSDVQNVWASANVVELNRAFSPSFSETFRIKYAEMKPLKSNKQKLEEIQLMREQKLITRRQALRLLNPDFSDTQLDAWIKELDDEAEENMEKMMMGMPSIGPERGGDGTFLEGNQVADNQNEESRSNEDDN